MFVIISSNNYALTFLIVVDYQNLFFFDCFFLFFLFSLPLAQEEKEVHVNSIHLPKTTLSTPY